MGLAGLQQALARLYTDAGARDQLRADPAAFALRHGLSIKEVEALALLPGIDDFAAALFRKRSGEALRAMPLLREVLGARLGPLFTRYAAAVPPGSNRTPALDALAFLEWLRRESPGMLSREERDAARYAEAWLAIHHGGSWFLIRRLRLPGKNRAWLFWWRWRGRIFHRS
ncbi:MAG: hypothetical protein V4710_11775 [Verrucomicrobiota bacterium]